MFSALGVVGKLSSVGRMLETGLIGAGKLVGRGGIASLKWGLLAKKSSTGKRSLVRRAGSLAAAIPEYGTKGVYLATFAPLAAVGYPVLKVGGLGLKGGWATAKGVGKASLNTLVGSVSTPGRRLATMGSAIVLGTGLAAGGQLSSHADRIRNARRDPANTMGLSQSLHYAYRRF